jgi:hypothetical protein
MRLFNGLPRTDYQDLFRALGAECDRMGMCDLRLVETPDGLLLHHRIAGRLTDGFQLAHYDDDTLLALLQDAYTRRGLGTERSVPPSPLGLSYQQLLRAVGRALDQGALRYPRLIEQPDALLLQVSGSALRRGFHTYRLDRDRLYALIEATAANGIVALGTALD